MSADITEERIAEIRERLEKESLTHDTLEPKDYFAKMCGRLLNALLSARSQLAALQSVPQGVEVPELDHAALWDLFREDYYTVSRDAFDKVVRFTVNQIAARLVPTPPQAAPGAVVEVHPEEFRRDDRYIVLKRTDLERHATPAQLRELERTCGMVRAGRATEGKRLKSYVVVADNWPEYEETWAKIQARVTGIPQPIQPEELRVGPDEVVVDRDYLADLEESVIDTVDQLRVGFVLCENCGEQESTDTLDVMSMNLLPMIPRIEERRTSAQDHNGEGAK